MKIYVHNGFVSLILETVNENETEREIVLPMQEKFLVHGPERKMIPKRLKQIVKSHRSYLYCVFIEPINKIKLGESIKKKMK
jgi:hypothetical protein